MNTSKDTKELENLREELNRDIVKYLSHRNKEDYADLLAKSKELDDIIVKHIKSSNKQI